MIDSQIKYFYQAKISYKGSNYSGWQIQGGTISTVQGQITDCLSKLTKKLPVQVIGSGRTDAGVHSFGQIARLGIAIDIPVIGLLKGLNSVLPSDIRIDELSVCTSDFHPQFGACWKTYIYLFTQDSPNVFNYEYVSEAYSDIDVVKFHEALLVFKGLHDFKRYQCVGTPVKSTLREIFEIGFFQGSPTELKIPKIENCYGFKVTGSGFLKQMVRLIAGTCFEYSRGKLKLSDIVESLKTISDEELKSLKHAHLAPVAQPQGLYLYEVGYSPFAR